jgi:hypothetical protein
MANVRDITEVTIVTEPTGEENLIAETDGGVIRIPSSNFSGGGGGGGAELDLEVLIYIPDVDDFSAATLSVESNLTFSELYGRLTAHQIINASINEYILDEDSEMFGAAAFRKNIFTLIPVSAEVASTLGFSGPLVIVIPNFNNAFYGVIIQQDPLDETKLTSQLF